MPSSPDSTMAGPLAVALLKLRLIWLMLLVGQLVFLALAMAMARQHTVPAADPMVVRGILITAVALLVLGIPLGYFLRNQCYKRAWQGNRISPTGYMTGNILLLAMGEAVAILACLTILLGGPLGTGLAVLIPTWLIHAVNFPTGRAMEDAGATGH